jgi:hypothetical protein
MLFLFFFSLFLSLELVQSCHNQMISCKYLLDIKIYDYIISKNILNIVLDVTEWVLFEPTSYLLQFTLLATNYFKRSYHQNLTYYHCTEIIIQTNIFKSTDRLTSVIQFATYNYHAWTSSYKKKVQSVNCCFSLHRLQRHIFFQNFINLAEIMTVCSYPCIYIKLIICFTYLHDYKFICKQKANHRSLVSFFPIVYIL